MTDNELEYVEEEEDLVELAMRKIYRLRNEREQFKPGSQEYACLTSLIKDEGEILESYKRAKSEDAQRRAAEAAAISANANRYQWAWQLGGQVLGNIAGQTIGALFNRQNVKTVVGVEEDGGLVNSKAMKFVK